MRIDTDKAILCLTMLFEGASVRSISRITGVHKTTILKLMVYAGERLADFTGDTIQGLSVEDAECDELWEFVGMKEKTKARKGIDDDNRGDAYCFIALERNTKLVVAWHLGRRTNQHADAFIKKLRDATTGYFQITTDAFAGYPAAITSSARVVSASLHWCRLAFTCSSAV